MVHGAYHGSHAWCTPGHGGLIEEDYAHIHGFAWNDLEGFERLLKTHRGQVAGVILTPFHHPAFGDSAMPAPGFLKGVETACRREGAVLILDDVRCGFRLHLGGSHRVFGFEPDLICFSKAIANGYPLSAALGRQELQRAAGKVFLTGQFLEQRRPHGRRDGLPGRDRTRRRARAPGENRRALREGLERLAAKHGTPIRYTGADAMPFLSFAQETQFLPQPDVLPRGGETRRVSSIRITTGSCRRRTLRRTSRKRSLPPTRRSRSCARSFGLRRTAV